MKKRHYIVALLSLVILGSQAQTGNTRNFGKFSAKQASQNYDSLLSQMHQRNSQEAYERFYNEFINIDPSKVDMTGALPDEVYEQRLKMMATEIQLPFNHIVKAHIMVYTKKSRMETILGRAQYYFPIFEEALYRHGLPMELKLLPVIESALIPQAKSHASAVGLWQFIVPTGKSYGLEINSFVDERSDPLKSTEAACRYLKDLYKTYGDWTLAIAAYNCGPRAVNRALARVPNASNYWEIYEHLPNETRSYLPAFIGATYAYTYHKAHNFKPIPLQMPLATDTIMVNKMMHFDQITTTLNIPTEILRDLNPQYRNDIIPARGSKYPLTLPQAEISNYFAKESEILAKDSLYLTKYLNVTNLSDASRVVEKRNSTSAESKGKSSGKQVTYKVKSGDTLGKIANKHGVTINQLKSWNGLKNTNIKSGQTLKINKN